MVYSGICLWFLQEFALGILFFQNSSHILIRNSSEDFYQEFSKDFFFIVLSRILLGILVNCSTDFSWNFISGFLQGFYIHNLSKDFPRYSYKDIGNAPRTHLWSFSRSPPWFYSWTVFMITPGISSGILSGIPRDSFQEFTQDFFRNF